LSQPLLIFVTKMAPQLAVADQATCTHPRRVLIPEVDNGVNTHKFFFDPLFLWSTDARCKKLAPQYLSLVHHLSCTQRQALA
jgi:hypothetical protein